MTHTQKKCGFNIAWISIISLILFSISITNAIATPPEEKIQLENVKLTTNNELTATFAGKQIVIFSYEPTTEVDEDKKDKSPKSFIHEIVFTDLENNDKLGFRVSHSKDEWLFPGPDSYIEACQLSSQQLPLKHLPPDIWLMMKEFAESSDEVRQELFEKLAYKNLLCHEEIEDDSETKKEAVKDQDRKIVDLDDLSRSGFLPDHLKNEDDNDDLKLVPLTAEDTEDDKKNKYFDIKTDSINEGEEDPFQKSYQVSTEIGNLKSGQQLTKDIDIDDLTIPVTTAEEQTPAFQYLLTQVGMPIVSKSDPQSEMPQGFTLTANPEMSVLLNLDKENYELFKKGFQEEEKPVFLIAYTAILNKCSREEARKMLGSLRMDKYEPFAKEIFQHWEKAQPLVPPPEETAQKATGEGEGSIEKETATQNKNKQSRQRGGRQKK